MVYFLQKLSKFALVFALSFFASTSALAVDVAKSQEAEASNAGVAPQCKTDGVTTAAKPEEAGQFLAAVREDVLSRLQKNADKVPPEWTQNLQEDVKKYRFWSTMGALYHNRGKVCFYNPDINEDLAKVAQSEATPDNVIASIRSHIYGVDKKKLAGLSDTEVAEIRKLIARLQPQATQSRKIQDSPCPEVHEKLKSLNEAAKINSAALATKNPLLLYLKSANPTAAEVESAKADLQADTKKGIEKIQSINTQDAKSSDSLALLMMNDSVRSVLQRYPHYCGTYASLLNDLKASEKFNSMVNAGLAGAGVVSCVGAAYFSGGLLGAACFVSSASLTAGSVDKYLSTVSETGVIQAGVLGQTAKVDDLLKKQREANGLLVEAGLGALGVKTGLGAATKVASAEAEAVSLASRTSKIAKADEVLEAAKSVSAGEKATGALGRKLTQEQMDAVEAAHRVGRNPNGGPNLPGKDGTPSGVGNYTWAQLREKQKILKAQGFSDAEVRKLMEQGVVGDIRAGSAIPDLVPTGDPSYDSFRQAFNTKNFDENSKYISYTSSEVNGRRVGKVVDSRYDSILIEDEFGVRRSIKGQDLASVRVSATAREGLDPKLQFRRSYSNGNLAESSKHDSVVISYRPDGQPQNLAVQVRKVHPNGQVEVMDSNGRSFVLSRSELESAKYSSADTKNAFLTASQQIRVPAQAQSLAKVSSQFSNQPGRTVGAAENYVSPRTVRYSGGEARFEVRSTPEFRDLAERQGLLKEFNSATEAKNLAPGNYSYLITRDGKLVVGKVEDSFELGVKHQNLANGREVVSAGELSVSQSGYEFNLLSGTYTRHMTESGQVSEAMLRGRTQSALQEFFGSSVKSTERSILPNSSPSMDTIRRACGQKSFLVFNMAACCQTVRIGCN